MDRLLRFPHFSFYQWFLLLGCLAVGGPVDAQEFPYTAYVTGEQAYVRSGPGQRYYPTGQVPQGYAVEVYRHDGDGWCAVRPTAGSFSWVASHQVRAVEAGIVEVVGEHVVARVGSQLAPNRSAVQVLLPIGELLELMPADAISIPESDDPRWVRIAAPAGEFRWIAASALSRQPPIETAPQPSGSGWSRQSDHPASAKNETTSVFNHLNPTDSVFRAGVTQAGVTQTGVPQAGVAQTGLRFGAPQAIAINEPALLSQADPNAMEVVTGSPAELQLAQFQSQSSNLTPPALLGRSAIGLGRAETGSTALQSSQPRVRFEGLTPPATVKVTSVEELELRLSQIVVEPPEQWQLTPLETAAKDLMAETKSRSVRAQLREVQQRITRFQEVQNRYSNPAPRVASERDPFEAGDELADDTSGLTGQSSRVRERVRRDFAGNSSTAAADRPLYDATGLLKPVISKRKEAPQYALVDEGGKVLSFVTPTPNLNLKPYIGRRIGVHGKRGFMPEYRRAHVTAGRVTPLKGSLRR